jgi:queuine tRNA-ribosyltransferase
VGRRDLRRAAYRDREGPIDPACACHTCRTHSIAYLFHLQRAHEITGWQLLGLHNIHFYMQLMRTMRGHILADTWLPFYRSQRDVLDARDSYGTPPITKSRVTKAELRRRKLARGRYEVVLRGEVGFIRDRSSGEVMHPGSEPAAEARALYVEQSRLVTRLAAAGEAPLVVWDVGLGAATNAMGAILAVEGAQRGPAARRLEIISFEKDLDSLKLALDHMRQFKHLRHAAPRALVAGNEWTNRTASIHWSLMPGDFALRKFDAAPPDIIYFDPFSFKTDGALWTLQAFRELAHICANRPVELFTYTYSTRVRTAMLAAGFHVAKGRGSGPKAETTIALSPRAAARPHDFELLGQDWLAKWRRSDAQTPPGSAADDAGWRDAVESHPQFS